MYHKQIVPFYVMLSRQLERLKRVGRLVFYFAFQTCLEDTTESFDFNEIVRFCQLLIWKCRQPSLNILLKI